LPQVLSWELYRVPLSIATRDVLQPWRKGSKITHERKERKKKKAISDTQWGGGGVVYGHEVSIRRLIKQGQKKRKKEHENEVAPLLPFVT
jgi:hypothetical protein